MTDPDVTRPDDGRPIEKEDALPDRFEVVRLLGKGGMGAVYRVRDTVLAREVAVKQLTLTATPSLRARLLREARAVARLDHPHVVRIHDVLEDELCIVMEYVEGRSLADAVSERGRLPANEVRRIGEQVLQALAAAHDAAIIHRDVKPANVLLSSSGARLTDFGIARVEDSNLTLDSDSVGTPAYMAPEQQEDPTAVDHRADLYSLGVVLYEAACGRRPTTSEGRDPDPERTVRRTTGDPDLARVIARALASRRDDRWASANEMLDAIRRRRWSPAKRFLGIGAIVVILVALGVLSLNGRVRQSRTSESRRTSEPTTAEPEEQTPPVDFETAHAAFRVGRDQDAREILERVVLEEPENGLAWFELAVVRWWQDEQLAMVDEVLTRGLAAPIGREHRLLLEAFREIARVQDGPAVAALREAPDEVRGSLEARYLLGEIHFHSFRPEQAMPELEAALEVEPAFHPALFHVLHYRLAHGRFDDAARALSRARERAPGLDAFRQDEILVLAAQGEFDRAIEIAEALARRPGYGAPQILGRALDHAGQAERAWEALERCAGPPGQHTACARYLAVLAAAKGRLDQFDRWIAIPTVGAPGHDKERDAAEVAILNALLGRPEPAKRELAAAAALVEGGAKVVREYLLARQLVAWAAEDDLPEPIGSPSDPLEHDLREALRAFREDRPTDAARILSAARRALDGTRYITLLRSLEVRAWTAAGNGARALAACEEVVHPPVWGIYRAADVRDCRRRIAGP